MKRFGCAVVALCVLAAAAGPALADSAPSRPQTISASGEFLGSGQELRGVVTVPVPRVWAGRNHTGTPRTALFRATPADDCSMTVAVSVRGAATRAATKDQVRHSVGDDAVRSGRRAHGAWGVAATNRTLYAIGTVHVTEHKYAQIRAFATRGDGCDVSVLRQGAMPAAFTRIVRDGVVDVTVVRSGH
jgi:hypothetical protein